MADAITAEDTRRAREFLKKNGLLGRGVSPRMLAGGAKDLGKGFSETLAVIADLMDDGQGQGQARKAQELA